MSDYQNREWIPWYCEDSDSWDALSLVARAVAEGVARKMGRKAKPLELGIRGLRALVGLLKRPWTEIEPGITELLGPIKITDDDGHITVLPPRLVFDPATNTLTDPKAEARRRAVLSTDRAKKSKDARAEAEAALVNVGNVPDVPGGVGNVANVPSPLLSSSEITDPDLPTKSPMRARDPGWHLDSPIPDNYREDARSQVESRGNEAVDVATQWSLYLSDRLRPEQAKRIGLEDWRGWVIRAIGFAAKDRRSARGSPPRSAPGGASAAARRPLNGTDD